MVALKPDATGMITSGSPHEQWRMLHNTPDVPSPLIHDGLVYLCRENGVLLCLEAKTGKLLYEESTHKRRHRTSPVYADGKIYLTARDGTVSVVKAGPKFAAGDESAARSILGLPHDLQRPYLPPRLQGSLCGRRNTRVSSGVPTSAG